MGRTQSLSLCPITSLSVPLFHFNSALALQTGWESEEERVGGAVTIKGPE